MWTQRNMDHHQNLSRNNKFSVGFGHLLIRVAPAHCSGFWVEHLVWNSLKLFCIVSKDVWRSLIWISLHLWLTLSWRPSWLHVLILSTPCFTIENKFDRRSASMILFRFSSFRLVIRHSCWIKSGSFMMVNEDEDTLGPGSSSKRRTLSR